MSANVNDDCDDDVLLMSNVNSRQTNRSSELSTPFPGGGG